MHALSLSIHLSLSLYIYIYIYVILSFCLPAPASEALLAASADTRLKDMGRWILYHHHHLEGDRSFSLNSSTFGVSEIASRRRWCLESLSSQGQEGPHGDGQGEREWALRVGRRPKTVGTG